MKYMGAKTRIAKEIVPIIQQVIYDKNITKYIPYANEKQYANSRGFDYAEFWETMRMWSHNNYVFISEMSAPDDFVCVWEKSVLRSIKATDKSRDTEKLYVWRGGLLGKDGLR